MGIFYQSTTKAGTPYPIVIEDATSSSLLHSIEQLQPGVVQQVARQYWLRGLSVVTIAHQLALSIEDVDSLLRQAIAEIAVP